jgi:hypothetical protein
MALRAAVASGNWSNPAIWNGGVLPTVGDVVASNGFTVTINQNINVDSITNTAQAVVGAVPNMTSPTTPSGIVTASQVETGSFAAWQAFGGDFNTEWWPSGAAWIAYEFPTPKAIDQYTVGTYGGTGSWTFEGWNGSTWIVLHTVVNTSFGYTSPLIGNSVAYIKYRLNYNPSAPPRLHTIQFYEYLGTSPAVAGGTFILNNGVTVTCTNTGNGILIGSTTLLTYSGTGSVVINGNIGGITANNINGFLISGAGNITINGTINASTSNSSTNAINVTAAAILNVNGKVNGFAGSVGNATAIRITASGSVLNLVGDVETRGTQKETVVLSTGTTLNMTGNAYCNFNTANSGVSISATSAIINITGNLYIANTTGTNTNWWALAVNNNCTINIVGTVSSDLGSTAMTGASNAVIVSGTPSYYKHIGPIIAGFRNAGFVSTGASNINILTGPFISSPEAIQPFSVTRMHYQRTLGSYYEFRDNSTNGALPPAGPAPITRLVSPGTAIDAPAASNVRQGVVYAAGSLTGTMVVPAASNVANNVPVDNTLGTAVLDPNAIWAVPLTSINTLNSIGRRVKNAATVETTGAQIQTTLNNNE